MDWFDSIIDGIGSAVNWVTSNSGTISGVVNAVSTVASLLGAASPVLIMQMGPTQVSDLFVTFNEANQYLENEASKMLEKIRPALPNIRIVKMSGLWTGASPIDPTTGNPSPEMYKDIAKFLVQNDIPVELEGQGDVALRIGQAIFADNAIPPPSPSSSPTLSGAGDGPSYIYLPNVILANEDNTCAISVVHAYYAVPLGKTGNDNAWHGALQLAMGTNLDFDRQYQANKKNFRLIKNPEETAYDAWIVTLQIAWSWVSAARAAYPYVQAAIKTVAPDYAVIYYTNDGQLQTIKIQAPENVTPAQVRAAINQAITEALANMQGSNSVFTSTKVDGQRKKGQSRYLDSTTPTPQMPDITVTSTALQPASS